MNLRSQKGINMITLSIAVIILVIITSILVYNAKDGTKIKSLNNLYNDIEQLNNKVSSYYLKNGDIPKGDEYTEVAFIDELDATQNNPNNEGSYYVINLNELEGVSLNYGKAFSNPDAEENDIYIINEVSHTIYYVRGIKVEDTTYYTVPDGWEKIKLSITPTVTTAPKTAVTEKTKYTDPNGDSAIIPEGFKVINEENQPEIDDGLVVQDVADNEWVWIPVDDVNDMITTNGAPYTLCGTSGETAVTASMASKSGIISGQLRTTPGTTTDPYYREPDLVVSSGTGYDAEEENYSAAGFTSLRNMAQSLVDDYEEMIESVEKNKGFYVGRYELSGSVTSPTEQGNKTPLTNQTWYNLYKACKGFTMEGVVESRMIWGCQWDVVCNYIAEDSTYSITDSSTWGNYKNTEVKSSDGNTRIKARGVSAKLNTGVTTFTMAKNIYDIAGNCWEWTQEAYNTNNRAMKAGGYGSSGSTYPASCRYYSLPIDDYGYGLSARPSLYIK